MYELLNADCKPDTFTLIYLFVYLYIYLFILYLFIYLFIFLCRSSNQPQEVKTSVAPRERPKSQVANNHLGLPIQTSIAPRKRPTANSIQQQQQQQQTSGKTNYKMSPADLTFISIHQLIFLPQMPMLFCSLHIYRSCKIVKS